MDTANDCAIEVTALTKKFGGFVAVQGATFSVRAGEIVGLIGPNGAGKSTLIKMLTTLLQPSSGSAKINGFDIVRQAAQVRRHIGYVPQLLSSDRTLTGRENMLLSARLYSIPHATRRDRIEQALATMGLQEVADESAEQYSGGMIRRLEIAQSMLHEPSVLFMDEPSLGLDPLAREAVWKHVRQLRERLRTTMMITSHYMEEVDELCDRVAIIAQGRILAIGTPEELKRTIGPEATLEDVFIELVGNPLSDTQPAVSHHAR